MPKKPDKPIFYLIALMMIGPLFVLIFKFTDIYETLFSTKGDYQVIKATIIKSQKNKRFFSENYKTWITFRYIIDGKAYVSDKYSFRRSFVYLNGDDENSIRQYSVSNVIDIYVKKEDNNIAVINLDDNSKHDFLLIAFMYFAIIIFLIYSHKTAEKKRLERKLKRQSLKKKKPKRKKRQN